MSTATDSRDTLFKAFGRAFFKRDVDALYETVTEDFTWFVLDEHGRSKAITGQGAIQRQLETNFPTLENVRFEDVVYHHAPEESFMTFRLTATHKETGARHEEIGVERYTFRNGRIAVKDVYRKPLVQ